MNLFKKDYDVNAKCSIWERTAYGIGKFGNNLAYVLISTFFLFYCTNYLKLNSGIVGTLILVSKFMDGISDFIMGSIIDRTKSKMGKARVWLLRACIPYAVVNVLLFSVPSGATMVVKYAYVFVLYNLASTVLFTCVDGAINTLNCLITKNQYERGVLGIFFIIGNAVAMMAVNSYTLKLVQMFGDNVRAWTYAVLVFEVIGVIAQLICVFSVTERVTLDRRNQNHEETDKKEEKAGLIEGIKALLKNKYWVRVTGSSVGIQLVTSVLLASVVYYTSVVLNDADSMSSLNNGLIFAQIIVAAFSFIIFKKLGKGKAFLVGVVIALLPGFAQIFSSRSYTVLLITNIIRGVGYGIAGPVQSGMLSDTIEYGEWKTGIRTEGLANGSLGMGSKIGAGLGTSIVGWILAFGGYDGSAAVQTAKAISAVKFCYIYIPMIVFALILVIMWGYKLDDEYPTVIKELEERKKNK
ncbi:MAG: glycoside-pentoside-hexuronide (GPH):cation symporter [Lachnospiraceae bacterium]|nr:glycoside-pentoside-hexuronide (GPH):cation symporter [Lachnospiraceae bacterium]